MRKNLFIALALFTQLSTFAQDSTTVLDEVIVTANKFPHKASLTGKVVTVISREDIEKSGGKDIAQILNDQAGIYVNGSNSNAGKDKSIYLRGANPKYTLIMMDGVPLTDPSGIGGNFDIRLLSLSTIERIEILKGGQSTLYGADAMAGVINIITKKTGKKCLSFSGNIDYGSFNTLAYNASVTGRHKLFDYTLSYASYKTDGINEATDTIQSYPHQIDDDAYQQNSFSATIGFHPKESINIQPYFRFTKFEQSYDQGAFIDELDLTNNNTNYQTGVKNNFNFGKLRMHLLYNYSYNNREYLDDSTLSRNGYDTYRKESYKGTEHFSEAYAFYPINQFIKLTGGISYRSTSSDQSYHSVGYYPTDTELGKDSLSLSQTDVYAALVVNLKSGINAELGGRWNHHSVYGNKFVYSFNPSYLFNRQWKIFANLSSAYSTPSLYQLYSEYGNKSLLPEMGITYEAGVQYYSKNNLYNGRVTYFSRKLEDVITFFTDPVTYASYYINQDKQNDYGIELESNLKVDKNTSIKFMYTYVDGNHTSKNGDKDTSYFNLIRRPKSTFNLSVSSTILDKLFFNVGLTYFGKSTDVYFDESYASKEVELNPYCLAHLYADFPVYKNSIKLYVDMRNILNEKYTETYGFNTKPMNTTIGLRFNY